jgi:hypothetical protein
MIGIDQRIIDRLIDSGKKPMEGEEERFVKGTVSGVRLLFLCVCSSRWSILGTLTCVSP